MIVDKKAVTNAKLAEIIERRWSPRAFDDNYLLEKDELMSLCEAMRWSPSCFGDEPWRVLIFDKATNREGFDNAVNCLDEWNQRWAKNSSVLFLMMANKIFKRNGKPNRWANYDTGAAAENVCLQAVDLGLMSHQIGGFDYEKTKSKFNIPDDYEILSFIAVGKQADYEILDEDLQKLELAPRNRSSLSDNFFLGSFDNPLD